MIRINQLFCNHRWNYLGNILGVNETVEHCDKCGLYYIYHWGIMCGYTTNNINKLHMCEEHCNE